MAKSINELNSDLFSPESEQRFASPIEARKKAMDFLARREHGRAELIDKLATRGFVQDIAEEAVGRLAEEGLQSDQRFVQSFIQSRISQGKGPIRIVQELGQRGLPGGLVEQNLEDTDADWTDLAYQVRVKKFGTYKPDDFEEKARQMRFLQYRGFDADQIRTAMEGERS